MFARRRRNARCVVGYGRPSYDDAAPMPADDGMLRLGSAGPRVVALQRDLNTVLAIKLALDGRFGPATDAALRKFQARAHITADGEFGPQSAAALRAALAGHDRPVKPSPRIPAAGPVTVDGVLGPATCAALQRALNAHEAGLAVDAAFGRLTVTALQKRLGVTPDGKVDADTVRALQKRVGAAEDGDWGSRTSHRHLQRKLNDGTF